MIAGIAISLAALFVGLEIIRRLTALELGTHIAGTTVRSIAFGPVALFMSAVYTESLFVMLSAGTFYRGPPRPMVAGGALGGLAATLPDRWLAVAGPRAVCSSSDGPRTDLEPQLMRAWWKPRYRFSPAVLWTALIPAASALFSGYLVLRGLGADATLHAQQTYWAHRIGLPLTAVWQGAGAAWHELGQEITGISVPFSQSDSILQFTALLLAVVLLIGAFRRLPIAYGTYVALGLLQALAAPTIGDPLRGLDRYASMRFPLFMCAAAWAVERGAERKLLVISVLLLVFFTVQFATWQWVGSAVI